MPPFQFQWLDVRPSQAKGTLHLLPPGVSPGICFSLMICPIRMFDSSLCCWLWLMPKHCSIGQRNLDCQPNQTSALWWWVLWNWCKVWRSMSSSTNETSSGAWEELPPKTVNWDPVIPQGHPLTQATVTDIRGTGSNSGRHLAHGTTPLIFRPPPEETPPVKSIASPTADNVGHTLPGLANPPVEGDTMVLSTPTQHQWSS